MSGPVVVTAEDAAEMTREQALRAMATADGVPERDRRLAQVMLAGPVIAASDERLLATPMRRKSLSSAVRGALAQMVVELQGAREEGLADLRELGGAR